MSEVYISGIFSGTVENPERFVKQIREARRDKSLSSEINVRYNKKTDEVRVETGKGRLRRPLIVVKKGVSLLTKEHIGKIKEGVLTWNDLISDGIIEYLDAEEEEDTLISFSQEELTPEHTHLEISPIAMLGLVTALVPYANFNSAQKVNTGSKNQKQALGFYAANYHVRADMDINVLYYPQTPIVRSLMHELIEYEKHPSGQNIVVAVMSYYGYNMEDAIIINKGSIERGLARGSYFKPMSSEELRYSGGLVDNICIPDKEVEGYRTETDYKFLEEDGIIHVEATVQENDVVVGKVSPPRFLNTGDQYGLSDETMRESSVSMKHGEQGKVDMVFLSENSEGNRLVQIKLRDEKIPEIGDKFSSRSGQKGVIGLIVPQPDMPFSASGITPDLLFSPQGIPTRMTMAQLIELIAGKVGALQGTFMDGTAFNATPESTLREQLVNLGFRENGCETLYDGVSGEQLKVKIYIGNMYYMRLKHMVSNKIQSRARGPVQLLTKQPTEGRAKEGGLRLGEMEKDTFVGHGSALLIKERFETDKTTFPICQKCGMIAIYDEFNRKAFCNICGEDGDIHFVEMAYGFKLLLDELKALCLHPKLKLEDKY